MRKYALSKRGEHAVTLELDDALGIIRETLASETSDLIDLMGTYAKYPFGVVGICSVAGEMILFIDGKKFQIADPDIQVRITDDPAGKRFTLIDGAQTILNAVYQPSRPVEWDSFSDEEDDLLIWLNNIKSDPNRLAQVQRQWASIAA